MGKRWSFQLFQHYIHVDQADGLVRRMAIAGLMAGIFVFVNQLIYEVGEQDLPDYHRSVNNNYML